MLAEVGIETLVVSAFSHRIINQKLLKHDLFATGCMGHIGTDFITAFRSQL